ncbi:glycosyl transferase [Rhizobium sp.]|jgi:predicted O-linked N-acetylglucosamine transferase (SPINDLY family)|uniref:O-linked N-acetylglucosamine transferase, SPINDLY family protein n=1 Tax=Rhizobium sp. TaxID=391 RepID=UPI000E95DB1E|nr:glycosyl transferase [Rhizobium sp.]
MRDTLETAMTAYKAGDLHGALRMALAAVVKDKARAGMLRMLIANIQMKLGDQLNAAENFLLAANAMPDQQAEFLKYAAKLFIAVGHWTGIAEIGLKAALLNSDDGDLLVSVSEALHRLGRQDDVGLLLPKLDMRQGRHLQLAINYCQEAKKTAELKAILDKRYAENPEDSFVAVNYFIFYRGILDFPVARQWSALVKRLVKHPDDPALQELFLRELALSRRYWCDDEALFARPSIDVLAATQFHSNRTRPRRTIRPAGQKLRIGYVSADFSVHATMFLIYDTLLAHDRERFEITLFCTTPAAAALAQAEWSPILKSEIVSLRDVTNEQAIEEISRREIDILVDLKGHTAGARMAMISGSDAPLKVTYLGFPGSVQGVELDYAITDPIVTPDSSQPYYTEKLCRLPESYQCNSSQHRAKPQPTKRADFGLPDGRFIFASFNAPAKITPETIDLWARVIVAVPDSLFWILCSNDLARENFKAEFQRLGVAPERIVMAEGLDYAQHISRVALADLALDTFPYNGHTTTSDLLWGGLPVLTKKGQSFASRVSESLLNAIGLPELVAEDEEAFVAKAKAYAANPERLAILKQRLAENRFIKPLFDTERFTRHLELGYEMMVERARAGLAPGHLDVSALAPRTLPFLRD